MLNVCLWDVCLMIVFRGTDFKVGLIYLLAKINCNETTDLSWIEELTLIGKCFCSLWWVQDNSGENSKKIFIMIYSIFTSTVITFSWGRVRGFLLWKVVLYFWSILQKKKTESRSPSELLQSHLLHELTYELYYRMDWALLNTVSWWLPTRHAFKLHVRYLCVGRVKIALNLQPVCTGHCKTYSQLLTSCPINGRKLSVHSRSSLMSLIQK